ncbi:gas vesicle protein GvpN [Halobacillus litoralis]|uniref:gas vesicle protein GvpN n=1 Tax=Halobacillus litoralis TaxID=45668 RepID=UPI002490FED3|nr:gas vesicle protein GvpN [Halobacillus litoralis]
MSKLTQTKSDSSTTARVYDHPFFKSLIKRSLRYLSAGYPVHYTGPSGIGKTTLALHVAKLRKRPVTLISGNQDLKNEDLIGAHTGYNRKKLNDNFVKTVRKIEENVSEDWVEGHLYEAVKYGHTLVYDEFTRSRPDTNNLFLSVIEEKLLPLYGAKKKNSHIEVHPDFSIIFTSNPTEYVGVFETQDALLDRMITLPFEGMEEEAEVAVVVERTDIDKANAEKIVRFIRQVNERSNNNKAKLSLRSSIIIADIANKNNYPVDGEDEDFQNLCMDLTYFHMDVSTDEQTDVQEMILEECRKI